MIDISALPERIASKIEVAANGCWLWIACKRADGYGRVSFDGKSEYAHRVVYELLVGPIPEGLELDHVRERGCVSTSCVNPAHLEPVTHHENILRGNSPIARHAALTHCPRGHPYDEINTYWYKGDRQCRKCRLLANIAWRQRRKLAAAALLLASCGAHPASIAEPTSTTTTPVAFQTTNLPTALTQAATTTKPAQRATVQIQATEPPVFDPVAFCNDLTARDYRWTVLEPAMDCYRVVASWYGWDDATIEARSTFVFRIMAGESAGCWNARRASWPHSHQESCSTIHTGRHDDVGFGQITAVLRPLTCEKAGICSTMQTIESPWNSMLAFVVVLGEPGYGKGPWCYRGSFHRGNGDCATWPG